MKYIVFIAIFFIVSSCDFRIPPGPYQYTCEEWIISSINIDSMNETRHLKILGKCPSETGYDYVNEYYMNPLVFTNHVKNFISSTGRSDYDYYYNLDYESNTLNYYDLSSGDSLYNIVTSSEYDIDNSSVCISPDGNKIAFTYSEKIGRVNIDGTNLILYEENGYNLSFSPDNSKILYVDNEVDLFTIEEHLDVTLKFRILSDENGIYNPKFHPDGNRIYYFTDSELKVFSTVNDSLSTIISDINTFNEKILFSDSGDRIAVSSDSTIFTMNENDSILGTYEVGVLKDMSSDGSKILYYNSGLNIMGFDGTDQIFLTTSSGYGFFSPDDDEVYFTLYRTYLRWSGE